MAPAHHYNLIKESDDLKDIDDVKDEPLHNNISSIPPWWKIGLWLALAFSAGLGATLGVIIAPSLLKSSNSSAANATAASTTLSADLSASTASATSSPNTGSVDLKEDKVSSPSSYDGKVLECGHSPEDALAQGCVYDVMMQDWVPEPCYDSILTEKYLAQGNYTWYRDIEGHKMTDEEMRKGEHGAAWMSARYHKEHCIFSWEKLIRALRNNEPISQELLSYDHVLHCRMQTLGGDHEHKRDEGVGVRAPTNYAKCALYDTWQLDFIPDKHSSSEK